MPRVHPSEKKSNEELVERLRSMAEEIANPLTAIHIRLHTLKTTLSKEPEYEALVAVDRDINRVQHILQNFLNDFQARLKPGKGKPTP